MWTIELPSFSLNARFRHKQPRPTLTYIYRHKMMSLVLLLIVSFDFNKAMPRKGNLKEGDMKNNENKHINIQKYILNILEQLTDARKELFLQRLWYILYCPKMRNVKIWSLNGPWVNNQYLLARIL